MKTALERLSEKGVSITKSRVAILQYLMEHHTHPIVETIFADIQAELPGISKTTVYNTIKKLKELGLIQMLSIDDKQICVDENTSPHGHLLCERCSKVYDIPAQGMTARRMINGNLILELHQYYKGICKHCLEGGD